MRIRLANSVAVIKQNSILLVDAGTYSLVATMPGYNKNTAEVTVEVGGTAEQDFQMEVVDGMGTIYGSVTILNGDDDQSVTISIRDEVGNEVDSASWWPTGEPTGLIFLQAYIRWSPSLRLMVKR